VKRRYHATFLAGLRAGRDFGAEPDRFADHPGHLYEATAPASMKVIPQDLGALAPVAPDPCVAVIIPCYNHAKYLARAIDSALAQTHRPTQVVVVNDGSPDATAEICAGYGDRIVYLHQDHSGLPAARNFGIRSCSSDLVMCLDADDWIEPSYIAECVGALRRNPRASIAYTATQCFGLSEGITPLPAYDFGKLLISNLFAYSALYKRVVWEEVGGYRTNMRSMEDYDFWVAAGGLGHFGVPVPRPLFHYRLNAEGLFEQDCVPNFDQRYRELVLNNAYLYPAKIVAKAQKGEVIGATDWDNCTLTDAAVTRIRQAQAMRATREIGEAFPSARLKRSFSVAMRALGRYYAVLSAKLKRKVG
jgi:glycosyltransferase involved in cell wall biosynthesis